MASKRVSPERKAASRAISNANLRPCPPINKRPPEERIEIQRKGQAASTKAKARKRALREILQDLLSMETDTPQSLQEMQQTATEAATGAGRRLTVYETIALAQMEQAQQGSTRAAEWVRDSVGDKPGEIVQSGGEPITAADLDLLRKVAARLDGNKAP